MNRLLSCSVVISTIYRLVSIVAVLHTCSSVSAQSTITISASKITAEADDRYFSEVTQTFTGTTIPTHATLNAVDGDNYSRANIDWDVNGGQTILSFGLTQQRTGSVILSFAGSWVTSLSFTVNSNAPYEASGFYNITDFAKVGNGGRDYFTASLIDEDNTTSIYPPFGVDRESWGTPNEHFTLGEPGGDFTDIFYGSLTGNLIAGHQYQFTTVLWTQAYFDEDSGASAIGNVTLKIGIVPEPPTLLLLGISAISLLGYRKAKSHG